MIPTTAHIINIIEQQAQEDNMLLDIIFKPIDVTQSDLWLAGVNEEKKIEVDEEKEIEDIIYNIQHDEQDLDN